MGGLLAIPNLRGGGEYCRAWHQANKKQNVFDDFIAAAEWLVDTDGSSCVPGHPGGSNGGLLVGARMTQTGSTAACLPAVGVLDMLRFHLFTIELRGRVTTATWSARMSSGLLAYSLYHNLQPGTAYPATMVTTGDTDDGSYRDTAQVHGRLQHAHAGEARCSSASVVGPDTEPASRPRCESTRPPTSSPSCSTSSIAPRRYRPPPSSPSRPV